MGLFFVLIIFYDYIPCLFLVYPNHIYKIVNSLAMVLFLISNHGK